MGSGLKKEEHMRNPGHTPSEQRLAEVWKDVIGYYLPVDQLEMIHKVVSRLTLEEYVKISGESVDRYEQSAYAKGYQSGWAEGRKELRREQAAND